MDVFDIRKNIKKQNFCRDNNMVKIHLSTYGQKTQSASQLFFFTWNKTRTTSTHPRNCILEGPREMIRLASPSPSTSGGGVVSFWGLTRRQVMRVGAVQVRGGMITRRPWCLLPRIEPPRASTMKLTRKLRVKTVITWLEKKVQTIMINMHLALNNTGTLNFLAFPSTEFSELIWSLSEWLIKETSLHYEGTLFIWLSQYSRGGQACGVATKCSKNDMKRF